MTYWALGYLLIGAAVSIPILRMAHYDPRAGKPLVDISGYLYPDGKPLSLRVQEWMRDWLVPVFVFLTVMAAWPPLFSVAIYGRLKERHSPDTQPETEVKGDTKEKNTENFRAHPGNLVALTTVGEVEAWERIVDPLGAVPPLPFGHLNKVWHSFKAAMQPGDELWSFASTRYETKHIWAGVRGYAIRRDGRVVAEIVVGRG
jgi:hypothetical protein